MPPAALPGARLLKRLINSDTGAMQHMLAPQKRVLLFFTI